ncbi:thiosulfate dehydrogenase [quinone] large subunit [Streptomyces sp. yr375]|nr:thiosulfate dehydrogenase [quinone] large subunit [Streptomyces sp. yr375]
MAVQNHPQHHTRFRFPSFHRTGTAQVTTDTTAATAATRAYAFASLRLLTGFVFLWARAS